MRSPPQPAPAAPEASPEASPEATVPPAPVGTASTHPSAARPATAPRPSAAAHRRRAPDPPPAFGGPPPVGPAHAGGPRPASARSAAPAPARVAVVRALPGLGDMLCAGPALRSLRAGMAPGGHLALVALPGTEALAARVLPMIDEVIAFPGCPGIPERPVPDPPWPAFEAMMRPRAFDLALQMQGDGSHIDAFMPTLAAARTAGYRPEGRGPDWPPYPARGHEIERWTGLMRHLGMPDRGTAMEVPEHACDREALDAALGRPPGPYACLHPGASTPARRWPAGRFAALGDALAGRGLAVVLTGSAGEAPITAAVASAMRAPALDLAGRTPLGALALLLRGARLLVTNDTGVSHLAAATRTPSVVVFLAADPERWAPLDRARHRAVVSRRLHAGALRAMRPSPHDVPSLGEVRAEALALL